MERRKRTRSSAASRSLGHFFVPLFFVVVGASVDVRVLNPLDPANRPTLVVGGLLIVVAVIGKFAAGYAPFWFEGKKHVIGVGMIPRGEVGLIFAQMGLAGGVFDAGHVQRRDADGDGHDVRRPAGAEMALPAAPRQTQTAGAGRNRRVGHRGVIGIGSAA